MHANKIKTPNYQHLHGVNSFIPNSDGYSPKLLLKIVGDIIAYIYLYHCNYAAIKEIYFTGTSRTYFIAAVQCKFICLISSLIFTWSL